MADKDFVVKNGLVVNSNVLVVNGANVGINTATPDSLFTVAGTANLQGNVKVTGGEINVTANLTVYGNTDFKNNVFVDKKLYVGNTATMVQNLPTIIQAVDNFNGFVMVSSQNLSIADDACADLLIYSDNTNGLTYFNDLGINNSRFDGRIHRIIVNAVANSWSLGEIVYQRNSAGANIAVGQIRDKTVINSTAISLKIRVSEDDGLPAPLVDMADFVNTAATNLSLYAVSSGTNADILHAVGFFSTEIIEGYSRRNYAFTIGKRGDGYLYNANSALTIGTTRGGMREITETISTSFSSGVNVITMSTGNTLNIKPDMDLTGTGIDTGTYITSVINSTAFRLSKPTTTTVVSGTITARDEFYDLSEANNPIIFHVGGMMGKNEIARFSGTGNFTIGPNTTNRNSKLTVNGTANLVGQVNVGANLNVVGNINTSANVNGTRGVFGASVNVGLVNISTAAVGVGANVDLDTSGLKITGNSSVPSIDVSNGNITLGNSTVTNTPTLQLANSSTSSNLTSRGLQAGLVTVNGAGVVNVGSNVFVTTSSIVVGNSTSNLVINTGASYMLSVQGNAVVNGDVVIRANLVVQGTTTYAGTTEAAGNFNPNSNDVFSIGNNTAQWSESFIKVMRVPVNGNVIIGNSTTNTVANFSAVTVQNSAGSFATLAIPGMIIGNSTVNGQYSATSVRIGNNTTNSVLSSTSLTIGNTSVNSTVNSSSFTGNVFAVSVNSTSINTTTVNASSMAATSANLATVLATTINSTSVNTTSSNSTTVNSTSVNATTMNTTNMFASVNVVVGTAGSNVFANTSAFVGNVVATSVRSTSINSTSSNVTTANATSVNSTTVNATTVNATTLQVGTSFVANSTDVLTANLTVTGNLVVTGSTTYMNTTVLDVRDLNITVAKGVPNAAAADGAGLTVDGANATLLYVNAGNTWLSNIGFTVGNSTSNVSMNSTSFVGNLIATTISGNLTGNVVATNISGNLTGNVVATSISGNLTGNVVATNLSGNLTAVTISASANISTNTATATNLFVTFANATTMNTTTLTSANVRANFVNSTSVNATTSNVTTSNATTFTVGTAFTANATLVNAISYFVGTRIIANATVTNATHLGGFPASDYTRLAGGTITLGSGGTNSVLVASAGAVTYSNASGLALTSVGTTNQVLISQGTAAPIWLSQDSMSVGYATSANSATTAGLATNIEGGDAGLIPYQTGSGATAFTAGAGAAGEVLTSPGDGSAPYWSAITGGSGTVTSISPGTGLTSSTGGAITETGTLSVNAAYINTLAPTRTGGGASGTGWTISITGSAASAQNLTAGAPGKIPYQVASGSTGFTAQGTAGQVLVSNTTNAPYWDSIQTLMANQLGAGQIGSYLLVFYQGGILNGNDLIAGSSLTSSGIDAGTSSLSPDTPIAAFMVRGTSILNGTWKIMGRNYVSGASRNRFVLALRVA